MTVPEADPAKLDRIQRLSFLAGAAGVLLCVLGYVLAPGQFFRSYLYAYLFWAGLAMGSLSVLLLHNLVGGNWGLAIRKLLESGTRTLPVMAVLLIPVLIGIPTLYIWATPAAAHDAVIQHKAIWLNIPAFIIRSAIYFAIWIGLAYLVRRRSTTDLFPFRNPRLQAISGPGVIVFCFTATFALVDWVMSLEPHWYSTIYALIFIAGQALNVFAFSILALRTLAPKEASKDFVLPMHYHDLGNLMLAFTMLWAYLSFSQLLIIYSGNLPNETVWYLPRMTGGYGAIALLIIAFQFVLPFLILLNRFVKKRVQLLAWVASLIMVMRLVDLYWQVLPSVQPALHLHWLDLAAPLAIGGIWLGSFLMQLKREPLFLPQIVQTPEGHA